MTATISHRLGAELAAEIRWADFRYAIVESAVETGLREVSGPFAAEDFETGVLFGPEAELRWRRRRSGLWHAVTIDDRGGAGTPLEELGDAGRFVLWGKPEVGAKPPCWWETRIPRVIMEYPARLAGKRAAVRLKAYRVKQRAPQPEPEGEIEIWTRLTRCVELEAL